MMNRKLYQQIRKTCERNGFPIARTFSDRRKTHQRIKFRGWSHEMDTKTCCAIGRAISRVALPEGATIRIEHRQYHSWGGKPRTYAAVILRIPQE